MLFIARRDLQLQHHQSLNDIVLCFFSFSVSVPSILSHSFWTCKCIVVPSIPFHFPYRPKPETKKCNNKITFSNKGFCHLTHAKFTFFFFHVSFNLFVWLSLLVFAFFFVFFLFNFFFNSRQCSRLFPFFSSSTFDRKIIYYLALASALFVRMILDEVQGR